MYDLVGLIFFGYFGYRCVLWLGASGAFCVGVGSCFFGYFWVFWVGVCSCVL